jgi:carboxyl-terminal processing protease
MIRKSLALAVLLIIQSNSFAQTYQQKMSQFLQLLDKQYVEHINMDSIVEIGITKMLEELDPHSVYLTAEELRKANEPLEGNFEGIGVQFNILDDTIIVVNVISGGPSQRVGLMDGDKIVAINGENVAGVGIKNDGVFKRLRGKKGTEVTVTVKRYGELQPLDFLIVRDKIPIYAVDAAYMTNKKTGYVKLSRFSATADEEVSKAIESLKKQGAENLILDLSDNSGGYLNQAHALADEFLSKDRLIVYTEGKSSPRQDFNATQSGVFEHGKLVIMIDEGTASASEIVSGAIQDWDRGLLVGRRTYGKGLVQKGYPFIDHSAVRLTVSKYFIPSGRCIQKPYLKGNSEDYRDDFTERYNSGEYFVKDSMKILDSTNYFTASKRIVYGGGGVIPDVFVPADTSWRSNFYSALLRTGSFNGYCLHYVNDNRSILQLQFPTQEDFLKNFEVTTEIWNGFLAFAKDKNANPGTENYSKSLPTMSYHVKALIGQYLFDSKIYYQIMNELNPIYKKALESLEGNDFKLYGIKSKG